MNVFFRHATRLVDAEYDALRTGRRHLKCRLLVNCLLAGVSRQQAIEILIQICCHG
jgi:hypothetical protein